MSYTPKSGHGYGNNHHRSAKSFQASRSKRSQSMDARLKAPIAKTDEQWLHDPSHYDLQGIDTPNSHQVSRISEPKKNTGEGFWNVMSPSSKEELAGLEQESYVTALKLFVEKPDKAELALTSLMSNMDLRKITSDMYVWQRVDAVKQGIAKAYSEQNGKSSRGVMDISTLPRNKEQENGNTVMAFEDAQGDFLISYGKVPSGGYSVRVVTPYDRYEIPAKEGLSESDVRRALRNAISTR